jgi:adenine-specific DNA-methyltransferase
VANNGNKLKEKLKNKLKEIFQFESEDLDFGIYRIMNYKRKEIERFIEEQLIKEIRGQLQLLSEEEREKIEEELKAQSSKNGVKKYLEALEKNDDARAKIYREDFVKDIEEYEKLKRQMEEIKISEDLEKAIYNHLINFFSRYYDNGDFISKRRYGKNEKYVIPYDGEEVALYWANKGQYYIKTTEYFRKYTFRIGNPIKLTVSFRVIEAEEEKGNIKAPEKKFFVLNERIFDFDKRKKELNIYFEYRALTDEEKKKYIGQNVQENINKEIVDILKVKIPENSLIRLIFEKEGEKTLIEKHLYKYTRRNTTDYFIHKDLKGFLERELDFYIKNEFLRLEDLQVLEQSSYFDKLRLYLLGLRAFRNIALKIIEFLAQIENFQKKIWEKKKFVIDTHYVITLDKIKEYAGEKFLGNILNEILSNKKQLEEWRELFGIEVKKKENLKNREEWKKLPIDTKYFDEEFKWKLLVALSEKNNLDEILDGVLIKSENWHALNLLLNKYYEKVQTIYIDPPFNTASDFLYKDNYRDSSWLSLMENRLNIAKWLLKASGNMFVHLDKNAVHMGRFLMNSLFGEKNFINEIIWCYEKPRKATKQFKENHENILFYCKNKLYNYFVPLKTLSSKSGKEKDLSDWWYLPSFSTKMTATERLYFETQKTEELLYTIIKCSSKNESLILDFFAGTGTTLAVAHKMKRKWIGIEMGEVFENYYLDYLRIEIPDSQMTGMEILNSWLKRGNVRGIKKIIRQSSKEVEGIVWKWGMLSRMKMVLAGFGKREPTSLSKKINWQGGGFFKYHTLEQYEDALENIEFEEMQKILFEIPDYFVKYMLEWETKNSKTFLNIDELEDPFNYKLKIIENYQQRIVNVDLVETFNYLLGLNVKGYKVLENNNRKYVFVFGEKEDKRITIIWRSIKDIDFEKDRKIIEENIKSFEPDEVYINRDALIKGFRPIEPIFKSLMFERVE